MFFNTVSFVHISLVMMYMDKIAKLNNSKWTESMSMKVIHTTWNDWKFTIHSSEESALETASNILL